MRVKFRRDPTAGSKKVTFKFISRYNPLNPPGVGWVKIVIFFKVEYLFAYACQIWARSVAKDFKQYITPYTPRGGVGQFFLR